MEEEESASNNRSTAITHRSRGENECHDSPGTKKIIEIHNINPDNHQHVVKKTLKIALKHIEITLI